MNKINIWLCLVLAYSSKNCIFSIEAELKNIICEVKKTRKFKNAFVSTYRHTLAYDLVVKTNLNDKNGSQMMQYGRLEGRQNFDIELDGKECMSTVRLMLALPSIIPEINPKFIRQNALNSIAVNLKEISRSATRSSILRVLTRKVEFANVKDDLKLEFQIPCSYRIFLKKEISMEFFEKQVSEDEDDKEISEATIVITDVTPESLLKIDPLVKRKTSTVSFDSNVLVSFIPNIFTKRQPNDHFSLLVRSDSPLENLPEEIINDLQNQSQYYGKSVVFEVDMNPQSSSVEPTRNPDHGNLESNYLVDIDEEERKAIPGNERLQESVNTCLADIKTDDKSGDSQNQKFVKYIQLLGKHGHSFQVYKRYSSDASLAFLMNSKDSRVCELASFLVDISTLAQKRNTSISDHLNII